MDPHTDVPEVIETPEVEAEAPVAEPEVEAEPEPEVAPDERDTKIAELEDKNKKLYARAKKAEEDAKRAPAPSADQPKPLSTADIFALTNAKVHEDDVERVEKFAKDEGISIKEALKSDELKAILDVRGEKRKTAAGANVSSVRRGPSTISDDVLLSNARAGKLPDSDDDISKLVQAKYKANRS